MGTGPQTSDGVIMVNRFFPNEVKGLIKQSGLPPISQVACTILCK